MTVLVLRALGIGDLATGVPALRGLRAEFPSQRITLATPAWLAPLAALTGAVDHIAPLHGLTGPLPSPAPAAAVNLHGRGPQSHRFLSTVRPARVMAFRCPEAGFPTGPVWLEQEHEVDRWCRMLRWYGVEADPTDLALRVPTDPPAVVGATVVHPGAKSPQRRWPVERFAAVARELAADGHHIVITGAPSDRRLAYLVARQAGLGPRQVLAGRTDVGALAALVASARLVICGDTGIAHLATGYGTPSVVLFGPLGPALWGPPPLAQHRVLWHPVSDANVSTVSAAKVSTVSTAAKVTRPNPTAANAPADRPHPALLAITAAEVLDAARSAMQPTASPVASHPPTLLEAFVDV